MVMQTLTTKYGDVAADLRLGGHWNLRFSPDRKDANGFVISASGPNQDWALEDLIRQAERAEQASPGGF